MISDLISGLKTLLEYFVKAKQRNEDQQYEALKAIYSAATETKIYLAKLERNEEVNQETEDKLSRMWSEAAMPISRFDKEFAERCLYKSEFWVNRDRWSETDIKEKRIGIEQISEDAKKLMEQRA